MIAIIGDANTSTADPHGEATITQRQACLLIRPELLKLDNKLTRPVMGDEVTFVKLNRRFTVVADPAAKACWVYSDGGKTFFKIYVDEIKPAT